MAPPIIPDHTLLRPIGRGAYGEVWLARNVMGTLRAVKLIWRKQFESERPFEREFAGIQHFEPVSRKADGLVHVLQIGRNDVEGYFYYVMELADDAGSTEEKVGKGAGENLSRSPSLPFSPAQYVPRTLASELKHRGRLPTMDCLRLALDVVSGLAQLHRHGLVHRDVKPGNIIYVDGRAKLADIGLVSAGGEARTFVGTEGYIPPEGPGTPAADLYAVGIVLYQAATGYSPDRIPDAPPDWFANDSSNDPLELHEVVLKACEGLRERRYQSAEALQADLALLQSGQSVRQRRALERRYARLRVAGVAGAALLVCALGSAWLASYRAGLEAQNRARETQLRQQSQQAQRRAEDAEQASRQQLYAALLEQARATVRSSELGHRVQALAAIRSAAAISNSIALRREAFAALALPDLRFERDLQFAPDELGRALDPALERFAVRRGTGPIEIRAISDQRLLFSLAVTGRADIHLMVWSPDGRYLALKRDRESTGTRANLEVWDLTSRQRVLLTPGGLTGNALSFHPLRPWVMAGRPEGIVSVWDLETARETRLCQLPHAPESLRFSPDGRRFAVSYIASDTNFVSIHDAETGAAQVRTFYLSAVAVVEWHPKERWLAVPDFDGYVRLIDPATGAERILGQHKAQAVEAAFSPDGDFLISGGWENELICWDLRVMRRAFTIGLNSSRIRFAADGRRCAVFTDDQVRVYEFQRPTSCRELPAEMGRGVARAAFSADGRWLAVNGAQVIGVWDLGNPGAVAMVNAEPAQAPCFAPEGLELYAQVGGKLARWRVQTGDPGEPPQLTPLPLRGTTGLLSLSVLSNDLVMTCSDGVRIRSLRNEPSDHDRFVPTFVGSGRVSPNERWLAIRSGSSPVVSIHRLAGMEEVARLTNRADVRACTFSPASDELAVMSQTELVFYDTTTWRRTRERSLVCDRQARFLYAPDGKTCWFTRDLRTSGLYDTRTLELLLPLPTGTLPLALSPDGRYLSVSVDAHRVQLWDLVELRRQFGDWGLDWK